MTQPALFAINPCPCCGKEARPTLCQPCRSGEHVDHFHGIRDYANRTLDPDPVYCHCPHCTGGRA